MCMHCLSLIPLLIYLDPLLLRNIVMSCVACMFVAASVSMGHIPWHARWLSSLEGKTPA